MFNKHKMALLALASVSVLPACTRPEGTAVRGGLERLGETSIAVSQQSAEALKTVGEHATVATQQAAAGLEAVGSTVHRTGQAVLALVPQPSASTSDGRVFENPEAN